MRATRAVFDGLWIAVRKSGTRPSLIPKYYFKSLTPGQMEQESRSIGILPLNIVNSSRGIALPWDPTTDIRIADLSCRLAIR